MGTTKQGTSSSLSSSSSHCLFLHQHFPFLTGHPKKPWVHTHNTLKQPGCYHQPVISAKRDSPWHLLFLPSTITDGRVTLKTGSAPPRSASLSRAASVAIIQKSVFLSFPPLSHFSPLYTTSIFVTKEEKEEESR